MWELSNSRLLIQRPSVRDALTKQTQCVTLLRLAIASPTKNDTESDKVQSRFGSSFLFGSWHFFVHPTHIFSAEKNETTLC
jgi:hypothetical protein